MILCDYKNVHFLNTAFMLNFVDYRYILYICVVKTMRM